MLQEVIEAFRQRWGHKPAIVVRAPGRVNLIGEHTDYNDGFVLPMAIDRAIWIALEPDDATAVELYSVDYGEHARFELDNFARGAVHWIEYAKGVAWALRDAGHRLTGWRGAMAGDIPRGAGLSSSAALELAVVRAFDAVGGLGLSPMELALLGQRAENLWVGVNCGIMDQLVSAAGVAGHALLIDCRTLRTRPVRLPQGMRVAILDTSTRRELESSAYNERRAQCEAGARHFGRAHLRDVTLREIETVSNGLDPLILRRVRHVVTENERTLLAAEALDRGDAVGFGAMMRASHESLRADFEVSSPELDRIVEVAMEQPGCLGARMTGAGFGGCAVAWVRTAETSPFAEAVARRYERTTGLTPVIHLCEATQGAEVIGDSGMS